MTKNGICIGDIYVLTYCGIRVILRVCNTSERYVYLYELATKRYKDGYALTNRLKGSKKPLLVPKKDNVFSRSKFKVEANRIDKKLSIRIDSNTLLYWEAMKYVENPMPGPYLAHPFKNYRKYYWKKPNLLEKFRKENVYVC